MNNDLKNKKKIDENDLKNMTSYEIKEKNDKTISNCEEVINNKNADPISRMEGLFTKFFLTQVNILIDNDGIDLIVNPDEKYTTFDGVNYQKETLKNLKNQKKEIMDVKNSIVENMYEGVDETTKKYLDYHKDFFNNLIDTFFDEFPDNELKNWEKSDDIVKEKREYLKYFIKNPKQHILFNEICEYYLKNKKGIVSTELFKNNNIDNSNGNKILKYFKENKLIIKVPITKGFENKPTKKGLSLYKFIGFY